MLPDLSLQIPLGEYVDGGEQVALCQCENALKITNSVTNQKPFLEIVTARRSQRLENSSSQSFL